MDARVPDPIDEPQAYQQHLLGLLGDDDPAEVQSETPAAIRAVIAEAGDRLPTAPEPGEWSAYSCIAHLLDAETVMTGRYRWVLAQDEPPLLGYDQDLWVDRLHVGDESVESLLSVFEPLRTANVALWRRTPVERRTRVGIHAERGPESFELAFQMIAGHDRFHLGQARRAASID
jgi:DinB superfamily